MSRLSRLFNLPAILSLVACSPASELAPFSSDGCSLFPDASLINEDDWCACCFEHDLAYWRGGSKADREQADKRLKSCVMDKTGNEMLAELMYNGVRFGGSPYFYNWYRWGYGWGYDRKYQPLTEREIQQADQLIKDYQAINQGPVCN